MTKINYNRLGHLPALFTVRKTNAKGCAGKDSTNNKSGVCIFNFFPGNISFLFFYYPEYNNWGSKVMDGENTTVADQDSSQLTWDDATWILTSAFIIFTMQSGIMCVQSDIMCVQSGNMYVQSCNICVQSDMNYALLHSKQTTLAVLMLYRCTFVL